MLPFLIFAMVYLYSMRKVSFLIVIITLILVTNIVQADEADEALEAWKIANQELLECNEAAKRGGPPKNRWLPPARPCMPIGTPPLIPSTGGQLKLCQAATEKAQKAWEAFKSAENKFRKTPPHTIAPKIGGFWSFLPNVFETEADIKELKELKRDYWDKYKLLEGEEQKRFEKNNHEKIRRYQELLSKYREDVVFPEERGKRPPRIPII